VRTEASREVKEEVVAPMDICGGSAGRGVGGRGAAMSLRVTRAGARVALGGFLVVVGIEMLVLVAVATLESNALARARAIAESSMLLVRFL